MNSSGTIDTYEELLAEKKRLEILIVNQKNIVRHDVDELKAEFRREVRPAADAAAFLKKIIAPLATNQTLVRLGTDTALDLFFTSLFGRSTLLTRAITPALMRNISSYMFQQWKNRLAKFRS